MLFSIGTGAHPEAPDTDTHAGLIPVIRPVIDDLFDSSSDTVEEVFNGLETNNNVHYIRWEPVLTKSSQTKIDNASSENIKELQEIAEAYFNQNISSAKFAPLKAILEKRVASL